MKRKHILELKIEDIKTNYSQKRDCYSQLQKFVYDKNDEKNNSKILALYGLRRTGKSTLLEQLSVELYEKKLPFKYYYCTKGSSFDELEDRLNNDLNNDIKIIFLDEVTIINDFIEKSAVLSDFYAKQGMKIIVAGTDSLSLMIASEEELYDRVNYIHTSYISFGEFNKLLNKDINDYIKYGGTLTDSPYKNEQSTKEYENTAIVNNIIRSIENSEGIRPYPPALTELYTNHEIVSEINKIISKLSQKITLKAIKRKYTTAALKQSINNHNRRNPEKYKNIVDTNLIDQKTKEVFSIVDREEMKTSFTQSHLNELKAYLKSLNLMITIPSYISLKEKNKDNDVEILLQPGMIFAHSTTLTKELLDNENWKKDLNIIDKEEFISSTEKIIFGFILENSILANTYINFSNTKDNKKIYISKLNTLVESKDENNLNKTTRREIDMIVVLNDKSYLFEIKSSNKMLDDHKKHLINKEFNDYINENFEKINGKYIIYTGEDSIKDKDVVYLNCETYLKSIYLNKGKSFEYVLENIKENVKNNSKNNSKSSSKNKSLDEFTI